MSGGLGFKVDRLSEDKPPGQTFGTRDGRHFFWFEPVPEGGQLLWLDGRRHMPFDELLTLQGGAQALIGDRGGRFAYVFRRGGATFVGSDGEEYGPYSSVAAGGPSTPPGPRFSPNGQHLVFYAVADGRSLLVLDGTPIEPVPPAGEAASYSIENRAAVLHGSSGATFSPDGSRIAFVLADKSSPGEWVVIDGVAGPRYDSIAAGPVFFSPDGRRVAYGANRKGLWRLVVDGVEEPAFEGLAGEAVFSSDGRRLAYVAVEGRRAFIVADGKRHPPVDGIADLSFSPDGSRLAYLAGQGKRFVVVVDGVAGPAWDQVLYGLSFSPDGRHLAFLAEETSGGFLSRRQTVRAIVDGTAGPTFDQARSPVRWSPDSQHHAFVGGRGKEVFVVVDGEPGPSCEKVVGPPYWSATGRLAYLAVRQHTLAVIADGVAGPALQGLEADSMTGDVLWFSPDGLHVIYLGAVGGSSHAIVDGQVGPPMQGVDNPVFAAGGVSFLGLKDDMTVRVSVAFD